MSNAKQSQFENQLRIDVTSLHPSQQITAELSHSWLKDVFSGCEYPIRPDNGNCSIQCVSQKDGILVTGTVSATGITECFICDVEIPVHLEITLHTRMIQGSSPSPPVDEWDLPNLDTEYFEGTRMDLSEYLRDTILLELPINPPRCLDSHRCSRVFKTRTCGTHFTFVEAEQNSF